MKKVFSILLIAATALLSSEEWTDFREGPKGCYAFTETRIHVSSWEGYAEEEIFERLSRHPDPDKVLHVGIIDHPHHSPISIKTLQFISDHFPQITDLYLANLQINDEELKHLTASFPKLERVQLILGEGDPLMKGATAIAKAFSNVEHLSISYGLPTDEAITEIFHYCLRLRGFVYQTFSPELASHSLLTNKSLESIAQYRGKDLRAIALDGGHFTWPAIKSCLHSSRYLYLYYNSEPIPTNEVVELAQTHEFTFCWSYRDEPFYTSVNSSCNGPIIGHENSLPYQNNDD